jgi:hypothetical protein
MGSVYNMHSEQLNAYANGYTLYALVEQENRQIIFLNHGSAPHAPIIKTL